MNIASSTNAESDVWIVGLRIDPTDENPTFFTLVTGNAVMPIASDGRPILADSVLLLRDAAALAGLNVVIHEVPISEIDLICDFCEAVFLIGSAPRDESAVVIHCLNLLFDFIEISGVPMPAGYRKQLTEFADHLTFKTTLTEFFEMPSRSRSDMIDAIFWCLGCVFTHSRIIH